MRYLTRATRAAAFVAIVLVGGLIAFLALNQGAASGPAADDPLDSRSASSATAPDRAERPLVEKMLDRLRDGRSLRSFDNPVQGAAVQTIEAASDVPVGSLTIPAMGLQTPFYEGVVDAVIDRGPGHWPGTPLPGQPGNAVLSGHRATHGAEFVDLDVLQPGDEIRVRVGGRPAAYTFEVSGTTIVDESRYVRYVTRQPSSPTARVLTLFACNPVWASTQRIVVRAELVGGSTARAG